MVVHRCLGPQRAGCNFGSCNPLPVTRSLPSGLPSPEPVSFASRSAVTVDPECPRLSITIGVGLLAAIVQLLSACAMTSLALRRRPAAHGRSVGWHLQPLKAPFGFDPCGGLDMFAQCLSFEHFVSVFLKLQL